MPARIRVAPKEQRTVEFTVYGTPRPQGSSRAFIPKGWKRAVITSDNKRLKPWRQEVTGAAVALNAECFDAGTPLRVWIEFWFDKPKSVKRDAMTVKPDVDKLIRAIFDSLKGVIIHDDAQVMAVRATKHYGSPARAVISVGPTNY